jgi:dCTP deaminase
MSYLPNLAPESADTSRRTTGILPSQQIEQLIQGGRVFASIPIEDGQVQPASLDLRLGRVAHRMQASFLPGSHSTVDKKLQELSVATLDLSQPTILEKGCVYLIPLLEELRLPKELSARANPKSTTGRLDVFTRLIADYSDEFEGVPAGYVGVLYAEVVPKTFSILVQTGVRLNQLRFQRGNPTPSDKALEGIHARDVLVYLADGTPGTPNIADGLKLSVSLQPPASSLATVIGYRAKHSAAVIDLAKKQHYAIDDFWERIPPQSSGRLILTPGDFYILASKERVRVPPAFAAEMVPFDPSVGEFRIHYAGFFDPGFGYGTGDIKGTKAVLEVRAHEVPFVLEDGQVIGRLIYGPLTEAPTKLYGVGSIGSSYQRQDVALSKQFQSTTAG